MAFPFGKRYNRGVDELCPGTQKASKSGFSLALNCSPYNPE
jgi:hypothetical protein